ncbi:MAG: spore maturation protein [Clostridiales bacterium]|nr:spore maturation protein [Clostridiales bacterium]
MQMVLKNISIYTIPLIFVLIISFSFFRKVPVFDIFLEGAREGLSTLIKIIPALVGLTAAIDVIRVSGLLDILTAIIGPVAVFLGIPAETLPLVLLRPVSGSASLSLISDMFARYGPDSLTGNIASVMMGSTETIFYTLTIYFGSIRIRDIRYTLAAALIADFSGILAAVWTCRLLWHS